MDSRYGTLSMISKGQSVSDIYYAWEDFLNILPRKSKEQRLGKKIRRPLLGRRLNGFLGLSLNEGTLLFLVILRQSQSLRQSLH